jgi:hypothetical protein
MSWTDTVHKFLAHLSYNTTLPTYTDGQTAEAQSDSRGRLIVSVGATSGAPPTSVTAGTTWVDTASMTPSYRGLISASASSLLFAQFQSTYGIGGYIQLHNLAAAGSLSSGVTVPTMVPIPIAAYGTVNIELPRGRYFSTGIVWSYSLTPYVYTTDSSATIVCSAEIV